MGYDRIAYFNGANNESTLICADKESSNVVYGSRFSLFCQALGFAVREVVDPEDVPSNFLGVNSGAVIVSLPDHTKAEIIPGSRVAGGVFVELKPPVDDAMTRVLNAYLEYHCDPSDAALILDYRGPHVRTIGGF